MTRRYRLGAVLRLASLVKERARRELARTAAAERRSASEAARMRSAALALDEARAARSGLARLHAGAAAAGAANAAIAAHRARLVAGLAVEAEELASVDRARAAACRAALRDAARDVDLQQSLKNSVMARIRRDEARARERRETESALENWSAFGRAHAD